MIELNRAQQIIEEVTTSYNRIADEFAEKRTVQWPIVEELAQQYIKPGQKVLDLGCGAGRVAEIINKIKADYVGMDIAAEQIAIAQKQYPDNTFIVGSMMHTGFPEHEFDHVLLIASYHHIPSHAYRVHALEELVRITKPGGMVIMTNWNLHQSIFTKARAAFNLKKLFSRSGMETNDILVPWKSPDGTVLAHRYYHGFTPVEMKKLIAEVPQLELVEQFYERNGKRTDKKQGKNLVSIIQVRPKIPAQGQ